MAPTPAGSSDAYKRFTASTVMDVEKWRDGVGYDLAAFDAMTEAEKAQVLAECRARSGSDWRDVELLQHAGGDGANEAITDALDGEAPAARMKAIRALATEGKLPDADQRIARELDQAAPMNGLDAALTLAEEHPGPLVKVALLRNVRDRPEVAVNYVALLMFLEGLATEAFDWDQRPFFLRFGRDNPPADRRAAFDELCTKINVDPLTFEKR